MSKLQPIKIRLTAFAFVTGKGCKHSKHSPCLECAVNLCIPVELTGFYDVSASGKIDRVEIYVPGDTFVWVAPEALCDEYTPMPIDYKTLRRALVIGWITGTNRHRPPTFGSFITPYQRSLNCYGG